MRKATLASVLFFIATMSSGTGALAVQPPPGQTGTGAAEEDIALGKLAALELAFRVRMDAELAKHRTFRSEGNWEGAYETYLGIERLKDEITARYLEYIAEHPESAAAYNQLGLISYEIGRGDDARFYWERAIELKPDFAAAHNNLATYYGHEGQPKKALLGFRKAIKLDPKQAVFHLNLATEYYTSRQHAMELFGWNLPKVFEEVMNEHRLARELEPHNFDYAKQYAETFYAAKYFEVEPDWEESIRGWYRALETDLTENNKAYIYFQIARAHLQRDERATAREVLEKLAPWMKDQKQFEMLWKRATEPDATRDPHKDSGE